MMRILIASSLLLAASAAAQHSATPAQASVGDWRSQIGAVVRIAPCTAGAEPDQGDLCMRVVKLSPHPPQTVDIHNPDPALRSRPVLCMQIGSGFHQTERYRLGAGRLYDPISGHTYRGTMTPEGGTLKLRGYVLFTLFGRTETWYRVEPPVPACP